MAGSLNGVGGGIAQQYTQTFKPGENTEERQVNEQRKLSTPQDNEAVGGVSESEEAQGSVNQAQESDESGSVEVADSQKSRGSLVNIVV